MSAETLRRAAALMRERAEAATPGAWETCGCSVVTDGNSESVAVVETRPYDVDAEHMASWHPAVALAVADWLEDAAAFLAAYSGYTHAEDAPLRVARAYLGESA